MSKLSILIAGTTIREETILPSIIIQSLKSMKIYHDNKKNVLQPPSRINTQQFEGKPSLEDLLGTFISETIQRFNKDELRLDNIKTLVINIGATIKYLEVQISQLVISMKSQQHGKFLSDTEVNLKEHCKAITLRSGKEVGENMHILSPSPISYQKENQIVAKYENETDETKKDYKLSSISFSDKPLIIKPTLSF